MADATYQPKVYRNNGGDKMVVASAGQLLVESGGSVAFESGGSASFAAGSSATFTDDSTLVNPAVVRNVRTRVTTAQVNAGYTLLAAISGKKYRIHDFTMIAIGGNASAVTTVDIMGGTVVIAAIPVATLTRSAVIKPTGTNVVVLADGASFVPMAAGAAVTVIKAGTDLATSTHIDVILSYTIET